jgi:hypothetical protein
MSELSEKIKKHLVKRIQENELSNSEMVEIIDTVGMYLNLRTVANYATLENISYNGVLARIKSGKIKEYELFGVKFIISNE